MAKTKLVVDPAHSSIDFSVKHMMVTKVKGTFHEFDTAIEADPEDLTTADIEFNIDLASVDTGSEDRDNHLKSADFFDVENNPKMTFKTTNIVKASDDEYNVTGDLTIKDVTKSETFKVVFEGQGQDPWGNQVYGFTGEGKINREDYGLTWNAALETGGVLVGQDVKISMDFQLKQDA
ncbi:YceI family protein [Aquibacillus albus]|uniref:Polyisoprenoid-binding protein YceI n=1 Tax=Aquibacillus albus TaxID=1168171 RepID=A0ABS2N301_9BACI|nr:YceI family protein [Aquibacillus albus]MBM7572492.1 polyisoprenoid-binding protein YceI [Aquibacillus albus]